MLTHRQRLIELISGNSCSLHELSAEIHLPVKEVLNHLDHVRRSVRPPQRFLLEPARCMDCGFVFKDRNKLSPPSRCPRCKSSHLQDPKYMVETASK